MNDRQSTLELLEGLLQREYPEEHAAGWRIIDYTYFDDRTDPHQVKVCKGRILTDQNCITAASDSPEQALVTAAIIVRG